MGRHKKYNTEEERKAAHREADRRWKAAHPDYMPKYRQVNKEKIAEQKSEYRQVNKEKIAKQMAEWNAKYHSTQKGRAVNLLGGYKRSDNLYNRGECTLTAEWIVEHIFTKPCHYCGETDWHELGCDRIDNSLPHIPDNVVPCCYHCNTKRKNTEYNEFMRMIGKIA